MRKNQIHIGKWYLLNELKPFGRLVYCTGLPSLSTLNRFEFTSQTAAIGGKLIEHKYHRPASSIIREVPDEEVPVRRREWGVPADAPVPGGPATGVSDAR